MKRFTDEQNNWLISYRSSHSMSETTRAFNERFGTERTLASISSHCKRELGLKSDNVNWYTEEEIDWLRKNFPLDESREKTYRRYVERFGEIRSYNSVISTCKKYKIQKPVSRHCYQNGNIPWTTGLTKEEHRSHFTEQSYKNMTDTKKHNFPNIRDRELYNVTDSGLVLSDLGDGSRIVIPYKIYKRLTWRNLIGKGELTKTQLLIELVKDEINEKENR